MAQQQRAIRCDNPWCDTSTKTHRSNFAKRKCDRSRSQHGAGIAPPSLSAKPSLRSSATPRKVLGTSDSLTRVSGRGGVPADISTPSSIINAEVSWTDGLVLDDSDLSGVTFADGTKSLSLRNSKCVELSFRHSLKDSVLDGSRMGGVAFEEECLVENLSANQCRMNDAVWGKRTTVSDSSMRWASMRRSVIHAGASFSNCDFTGVDFSGLERAASNVGVPVFSMCEFDMTNWSGADLRSIHFDEVDLAQRIYFVDQETVPPLEPGTLFPSDQGREFMTRAMTDEQFAEYTSSLGVSEVEVREALLRLSPSFAPVYDDGRVGSRGELFGRAMRGEDIDVLVGIQRDSWQRSLSRNTLLVDDPDAIYR